MNNIQLAQAVRRHAEEIQKAQNLSGKEPDPFELNSVALLNTLALIIEGESVPEAFGDPRDWGNSPIRKALESR